MLTLIYWSKLFFYNIVLGILVDSIRLYYNNNKKFNFSFYIYNKEILLTLLIIFVYKLKLKIYELWKKKLF